MHFLVLGGGSIGKRHIGNLQKIGIEKITLIETREDRQSEVREKYGIQSIYASLDEAFASGNSFDAAVVAIPTAYHIPPSIELAKRGVHLFVEKPLSHNLEGLEELTRVAKEKNVQVMTAYVFRFHKSIQKMKELLQAKEIGEIRCVRALNSSWLPDWHPWEDYRNFYMASLAQGGGVLLDESHSIDMVRWLAGEITGVFCIDDHISDLEVQSDDVCSMTVRFANGAVGSIHMDMLGRDHRKSLEIIGSEGTIVWTRPPDEVKVFRAKDKAWETFNYDKEDFAECYIREMQNFIGAIEGKEKLVIDILDGVQTMKVIMAAFQSSDKKTWVNI